MTSTVYFFLWNSMTSKNDMEMTKWHNLLFLIFLHQVCLFLLFLLLGGGQSFTSTVDSRTSVTSPGCCFNLIFQSEVAKTSSLCLNKNWMAWLFKSVALWISASMRMSTICKQEDLIKMFPIYCSVFEKAKPSQAKAKPSQAKPNLISYSKSLLPCTRKRNTGRVKGKQAKQN